MKIRTDQQITIVVIYEMTTTLFPGPYAKETSASIRRRKAAWEALEGSGSKPMLEADALPARRRMDGLRDPRGFWSRPQRRRFPMTGNHKA
jgi:hypothetical protein